ncbi:two-component sensor histidine kinase [Steroidobacter agaridevorans]|uniref:histidine kinase n=1 Tax=Steroidobacter agaridevorans TaxID=2695856 RepID=A0A829YCG6_9GAMM|nr:ATP-binding protein [Steroidobacter agaridevorans]GFE80292.1 two-component sensor histidine kinase [Steroidobacter agaridevorans]GFE87345.1 two-component sensor histidine kinase [Steroidobacter agaridevorans]
MARHFLQLYLAIVATLAIVSWGQDRLWHLYAESARPTASYPSQTAVLTIVEQQLQSMPQDRWPEAVADLARNTGLDLELMEPEELTGIDPTGAEQGKPALWSDADDRVWALQRIASSDRMLAFRFVDETLRRTPLEWLLVLVFYAAIALIVMLWLWPLRRDLRALERSTLRFGNRNWSFDADISPRSPVASLADAFGRMARRIDALIRSHKDMANAMSHEIKTPLARMRFEIELARSAENRETLLQHLDHLNTDIAELNAFVTATLEYAVLERAEVALNLGRHDFTLVVPAVTESVRRGARNDLILSCEVADDTDDVVCDAHLIETVLRNLLYNATRYAKQRVHITFKVAADSYRLYVEDDGPGIPAADRERVFGSFIQLGGRSNSHGSFGLGLAIVKRAIEWHGGAASVDRSPLGGARFIIEWPVSGSETGSRRD